MRIHYSTLLTRSLIIYFCCPVASFPYLISPIASRQSNPFSDLALPQCALTCFINAITNDGCADETDFECHCKKGLILMAAASCLQKSCSAADREKATDMVEAGCQADGAPVGGSGEGDGGGGEGGGSSQGLSASSTTIRSSTSSPLSGMQSSSPARKTSEPTPSSAQTSATTTPPQGMLPTASSLRLSLDSTKMTRGPTPTTTSARVPTNTPLALLPIANQLSAGAKAGISVSVIIVVSSILILLGLYIRRLKQDLKAAKAAAGIPESVWRAHIETAAAAGAAGSLARGRSWRSIGSRRRGSSSSSGGDSGEAGGGGGFGAWRERRDSDSREGLFQKGRPQILSVVVEGTEEEDEKSTGIREPVPGQREGLVDPLEIDGEDIVELPTSITPRTRSRERRSGESRRDRSRSRPGTR